MRECVYHKFTNNLIPIHTPKVLIWVFCGLKISNRAIVRFGHKLPVFNLIPGSLGWIFFFFFSSSVDRGSGQSRQRRVSINEDTEAFRVEEAGIAGVQGVCERAWEAEDELQIWIGASRCWTQEVILRSLVSVLPAEPLEAFQKFSLLLFFWSKRHNYKYLCFRNITHQVFWRITRFPWVFVLVIFTLS